MAQTTIDGIVACHRQTLPEQETTDLLRWFQKGEFSVLVKLAEGKVREHMADAVRKALESKEHPLQMTSSNVSLQHAQRYTTFLEVLQEFKAHKEPYQSIKWT